MKVSEFGWEGKLLSEFEEDKVVDGGYQEPSRLAYGISRLRVLLSADLSGRPVEELEEAEELRQIE